MVQPEKPALTAYVEHVRDLIIREKFNDLPELAITKPVYFNWVTDVFEALNVAAFPEKSALIWTNGDRTETFTFSKLAEQCNQLLNLLRANQVQQGDIILSQLSSLPPIWTSILAVIKGGFKLIPVATILGVSDLVYRFGRLTPKVILADPENAEKIDTAEKQATIHIGLKILTEGHRDGWITYDEIRNYDKTAEAAQTRADDPLFLFFTSGTTGMPKIVSHTHFTYPIGHLTTASWIGLKPDDLHYNIAQPGWAKFAWSSVFAPWNMGSTIFSYNQPGRFDAKWQLQQLETHKVTTFCCPPTVLRMLIQEDLSQFRLSLRACVAAGEPLNPEVIDVWRKGTGITIRDGFGQTESSCIVGNLPNDEIKPGSMGKPLFLYDVVIASDEGQEQPLYEEGTICVRMDTGRPNGIFSGYFNEPEKMKAVFREGLYFTGDKAYKDQDGYIWFVGRDDDVIKSSDYRVGPFEVESALLEHDVVVESAVVGSPHPVKGFEIKAFVVLVPGSEPSKELAELLFSFSREHLAPFKMPRIIEFVNELPKTISGKIRRVELRAREARNKLDGLVIEKEYCYAKKS
ncbi:acyl--CoA ligase [Larkinella rosea]|uniref:Branched-chain amino acid aminotransferase n=1 Tax=Larkinella rosea TaxID=2025312 RepID=A0A3P1BNQ5_9BACT|nr:acyl--CoA ligase [Larkinella rosea]RRB02543.1 branched-chain amino acid aminotransferase [Larkinella rosea]